MSTSVGCFDKESSSPDGSCWMAAWKHKLMTHNRQNRLISKSVAISSSGTTGSAVCDISSDLIDFTGSPVMCQTDSISYISAVVWEDKGKIAFESKSIDYSESIYSLKQAFKLMLYLQNSNDT